MTTIKHYRIYCTTENGWVEGYGVDSPTGCYNNNGHTVNSSSVQKLLSVSESTVKINEGSLTDTGKLCVTTLGFDCDSGTGAVSTGTINWEYKISALRISFSSEAIHRGDKLDLIVGQNTPAGTLASDISPATAHSVQNYTAGDVVTYNSKTYTCHTNTVSSELPTDTTYWQKGFRLHVDSTVTTNVNHGYRVRLTDGTNTDEMGEVWAIDKANDYIYVANSGTNDTPLANSYSATSPDTAVQLSIYMMENFEISGPWFRAFGCDKIGGSDISDGIIITICYTNVDGVAGKRFVGEVEFLRGESSI